MVVVVMVEVVVVVGMVVNSFIVSAQGQRSF